VHRPDGDVAEPELLHGLHQHVVQAQVLPVLGDLDRVCVHPLHDVVGRAGQCQRGAELGEERPPPGVHDGEVVGVAHHHAGTGHLTHPVGEADVVGVVVGEEDGGDRVDAVADALDRPAERPPATRVVVPGVDQHGAVGGLDEVHDDRAQRAAGQRHRHGPDTVDDLGGSGHLARVVARGVGVADGYGHCRSAPLTCVQRNIPDGRNATQGVR
jgi:hypothetical protein